MSDRKDRRSLSPANLMLPLKQQTKVFLYRAILKHLSPFILYLPRNTPLPIVANLPHSGLYVPEAIQQHLQDSYRHFLPHQDWHLDRLYDFLPDLGMTVLQATHSRYVVDLNRSLDRPQFGNFWNSVIPEKTAFNAPLYRQLPSATDIEARIEAYYRPYRDRLHALLKMAIAQFGRVYLLDLHSFLGLVEEDICLGNGNGKTCSEFLMTTTEQSFVNQGYQVVRNKVFSGGNIVRHYGQMAGVEALQIEIRYTIYLNPEELDRPHIPNWQVAPFVRTQQKFHEIFSAIAEALRSRP